MRNFAPKSEQFNERLIVREQKNFSDGAFDDVPGMKVPAGGVKFLDNYIILPDGTLETRPGTRNWSTLKLPAIPGSTGLSITKSGTTITNSINFEQDIVGAYIVYDDGKHELITALQVEAPVDQTATVEGSTAHAASTAAYLRGAVYGVHYHAGKDRIILHIHNYIYVCNGALSASPGWVRCIPIGPQDIGRSETRFEEINNKVVAFNSEGIFTIDLDYNPDSATYQYCYYQTNAPIPDTAIADYTSLNEYEYRYRYLYTFSRIRGAGIKGDRTTTGAVVDHESGPVAPNASTQIDYGTVYLEKPIGPGTITNGVLTGRALYAPYNTVAAFSALSDAEFTATFDSVSQNIVCDFTGVTSWTEIAEVLQLALRDYFDYATVEFDTDHFIFTNKADNATIGRISAGLAGTDIGGNAGSGRSYLRCSVLSEPAESPALPEGTLTTPAIDAGTSATTGLTPRLKMVYPAVAPIQSNDGWTHYSIYRTLDIGVNGMDPQTGQGNNKELYVWVMDVPITKAFRCTIAVSGSNRLITSDTSIFSADDIGSEISFGVTGGDNYGTILSYTSATQVVVSGSLPTISPSTLPTKVAALIGIRNHSTPQAFRAYQSGTTITIVKNIASDSPPGIESSYVFSSSDGGKVIHWEDGTISVLAPMTTDYISPTQYTASWSATHGASNAPVAACTQPIDRGFNDTTTDAILRARTATMSMRNRFWSALPSANCGTIDSGYMLTAPRASKLISYSQLPQGLEYLYGYHRADDQVITTKDLITSLEHVQSMLIVYCYNSIINVPLNTYREEKREELGETIIVLMGQNTVSPDIGCIDYGSIVNVDGFRHIFITNNCEIRMLQYTGEGISVSENIAKDRYSKLLAKSAGCASVSYDRYNGIIMWLRTSASGLGSTSSLTGIPVDTSYRQSINPDQGLGWSRNSGSSWVMPPAQVKNILVYDAYKLIHSLVIDNTDGMFYDIGQRDGATGVSIAKIWKDKAAVAGTGGVDVAAYVLFGEDAGEKESQFIQLLESHFVIRCSDNANRNATGFTSDGLLTGTTFDLDVFADGEPTTASITNVDVVKIGDIVPDKIVRAHSLQLKLSSNKGAHRVVSRLQNYEIQDIADTPENNTTTEMDNQQAFAEPILWLLAMNGVVKNLATGETFSGAYNTVATGLDGNSSAVAMVGEAGLTPATALTLSGNFSLMVYLSSITATSTIMTIGLLTISVIKAGSVYSIRWADGTDTVTQALGWDGTGTWGVVLARSGTNLIIREGYDV